MVRKKRRKKRKLKKSVNKILILFVLIITVIIGYRVVKINKTDLFQEVTQENKEKDDKLYTEYTACLTGKYQEEELNEVLQNKIDELTDILSKYHVSVGYEDIMTDFKYTYNSKTIYYAASTVKILDAIYAIDKYYNKELDLNEKVLFRAIYNIPNSKFLNKQQVGSYISIKDLVKNAVMVSDNGAHIILYDYFGYKNLKNYATSLGATNALVGDQYGNISVNDALIYLKKLNELINKEESFGEEIKSWFTESDENYIKTDTTKAAVKYGGYNEYFHNVGIVYADNPYYLVILSTNGNNKSEKMIKEISAKVEELHDLFYSNRQEYCTFKVYN